MSWDPNQPQGQQPPSGPNPYGQPPSGPNPYGQPTPPPISNPYEQQQQYTPPPQSSYGQQQYMPPPQSPYEQPGMPYTIAPPQGPQPLGQALQALPNQYLKIVTKPGAQSFAEEQGKADWASIWIQLLFIGLIGTVIGLLRAAMFTAAFSSLGSSSITGATALLSGAFAGSASAYSIITVIAGFFIIVGIQYLLAKAFGGNGDFKQQAYNYLLFYVPLTLVSNVVGLVPVLGGVVGFALGIYQIVLNVFSIMAVHRLSGGKATWVVLIPILAIIALVFLCVAVFVAIFAAALNGAAHP